MAMPTGLKQSSSVVAIGFSVDEVAANTFAQSEVDLNLSPLDREVFVVLAVNLNPYFPDMVPATNTQVSTSLTTTRQTTVSELSNSNCLASAVLGIRNDGITAAGFQELGLETPPATLEYIGIIATNDLTT